MRFRDCYYGQVLSCPKIRNFATKVAALEAPVSVEAQLLEVVSVDNLKSNTSTQTMQFGDACLNQLH